jgi:hypothetical protein
MALGDLADIADLLAAACVIASMIYVGYCRSPGQVTRSGRSAQRSGKIQTMGFFSAHVRHCQNSFYQRQQGLLDEYFSYGIARTATYWIKNYP